MQSGASREAEGRSSMGRIKRGQMALTIIISLIIFACLIVAFERSAHSKFSTPWWLRLLSG
jgi:hypothetical protein